MTTNEGRVYFELYGDHFDPDELTEFLGIEPTSTVRAGDMVFKKPAKQNSWELSTENIVDEFIDIYELSSSLINILKPKQSKILEAIDQFDLSSKFEVVLWFSVNENHSTPAIGFEAGTIELLGEIGAFIDIDTYKHYS